MFTLYRVAFRSVVNIIPDSPSVFSGNAIFVAMFITERRCSAPLLKVVRHVSDRFSNVAAPFTRSSHGRRTRVEMGLS